MYPSRRSSWSSFRRLLSPACVVLGLLLTACSPQSSVSSEGAGHHISAQVAGDASIESHSDSAIIRSAHAQVIVERERVRLDDLAWTAIPAGVPVDVTIRRNHVRIRAGNVTVARTTSN